jgi:16S rRNA (cytosine1402-N4)-methyltransferase
MVPLDGIMLDLGVSSHQLDEAARGFTYRGDAPLDMRMDPGLPQTAADLLASLDEEGLAGILREYGEVRAARRLAASIVRARVRSGGGGIEESGQLRGLIAELVPPPEVNAESSRVFQALRIAVNDELGQLTAALEGAIEVLAPGGRLVVIAYHSLEDRLVKHFFRDRSTEPRGPRGLPAPPDAPAPVLRVITRRPIRPDREETADNPRARSARLRVAERLSDGDRP